MIHEYKHVLIEILQISTLTNKEICGLAFNCVKQSDIPMLKWNVTFPDKPKPDPIPPLPPSPSAPTTNVLHLTDLHIDFEYTPGSNAECGRPLCCRSGSPSVLATGAGYWGDYRTCDLPLWTAEAIFNYIARNEEFDIIYFTGDLPPHNIWNQSYEDQLYSLNRITDMLATIFPNKKFYPAVGNHEAYPSDLFPTSNIKSDNISWLYDALANKWINQLGLPNDTRSDISLGAYYTTLIKPGLRLISLNTNYCTQYNYWLFISSNDPLNQLQWLIQWLQYAEDNDEKVHIIGHIPPPSCLAVYSWNYYKIINRYENTVTGQFFGHTHNDEFMIFYDELTMKRPVSVAYVAPSLTSYSSMNPGYRMYSIDMSNTSYVVDHRTNILNLTATNWFNKTVFLEEYSARNAYNMTNLFPNDWNDLVERMQRDIDGSLIERAYQYFTKSFVNGQCDRPCRLNLINCHFKTARSEDTTFCTTEKRH
ncbi:unnamed protein product [Didymodactylos carnosus]|uniref:Sphingomyelin phosphodiesterase n=1 Tax=Didymodactylos carnosus TaxID=1234261 RepID=A0A814GFY2_9BILA|nr:unnamed protein product [Didymodactylos carnosus]CAF0995812.1 unnamed protein product [Didymodactylos carnosus]CAF3649275.1 unnamed protein product [Didymodactylos carnosus]CAF3767449.1 unnamed protein product [Didymodactylos carnosus]